MEEDWKPFEIREAERRTTLYLHGTEKHRIKVEADKVGKILEAIRRGWSVDIRYAVIDGGIDIGDIELERDETEIIVIAGKVWVRDSDTNGVVSFDAASFNGTASFYGASFNGEAYFGGAGFNEAASFYGASFNEATSFERASFNEGASFYRASFKEAASFLAASFNGEAYFDGTSFNEAASFYGASFNEVASFLRASFKHDPALGETKHDKLSSDSFASIGLAYRKSTLSGASYFFGKAGHGYWNSGNLPQASEAFRDAKVEYEKEGKYDEAGAMYVWEKDSTRRQLRFQKDERLKWIWFWIWKHVSNYGEAPLRFIGIAAIIIAFFALLYLPIIPNWLHRWPSITFKEYPFQPWSAGVVKGFLYNIMTAFYFSAVTFATLGFGDIAPVSIVGKFLTVVQVLLGYVMFGILITLVARKMTRS